MIGKKYKLPIQEFYKKTGRTIRGPHFLVKIFSPEKNYSRAGVVISKKISPKATERNKLKRLAFNFFRENLHRLPVNDYLVIFSPSASKVSSQELLLELNYSLKPKN